MRRKGGSRMSIDFNDDRWLAVKRTYGAWWKGELERPLIPLIIHDRDPGRPPPEAPVLTQRTCADLSIPAEDLIAFFFNIEDERGVTVSTEHEVL